MESRAPHDDFLKAAQARAQQRERAESRRQESRRTRLRWLILGVVLLLLIGWIADLRHLSTRLSDFKRTGAVAHKGDAADLDAGMDGPRYRDPSGRFSLVPPRNWVKLKQPPAPFYNAVYQGPYGMDMSIQVVATNGLTFDKLIDKLKRVERGMNATTHMDYAYVGPYRAVKRSVQLFKTRVLILDFVTGDLAHHIQFSVPPALYDEYEPVFLRLMQSYQPGQILPPETLGE
jgi:hypothetical protein